MAVPIIGRHRIAVEATDIVNLFSVVCECGWREACPFGEGQAVKVAEEHLRAMGKGPARRVYV